MNVWFFLVLVVGVLYALNRLTSTTDLPVSARLAQARDIVEQGRRARTPEPPTPAVTPPLTHRPAPAASRAYCATRLPAGSRTGRRLRHPVAR